MYMTQLLKKGEYKYKFEYSNRFWQMKEEDKYSKHIEPKTSMCMCVKA